MPRLTQKRKVSGNDGAERETLLIRQLQQLEKQVQKQRLRLDCFLKPALPVGGFLMSGNANGLVGAEERARAM
eukprot:952963-Pleurochrysis_carterae.AAC.1